MKPAYVPMFPGPGSGIVWLPPDGMPRYSERLPGRRSYGDFQDAVVGAGGKIEALHGDLQQRQAGSIRHGVFMKQFGGHPGIAVNTFMRGKAFFLDSAGFHHALAYRFATFGKVSVGYLLERDRHDFYLYIDPVEQRAGNTIHVFTDSTRREQRQGRSGVIIISARTRIHGSDQHEVGRIINR